MNVCVYDVWTYGGCVCLDGVCWYVCMDVRLKVNMHVCTELHATCRPALPALPVADHAEE
jgi:hypothetical protein